MRGSPAERSTREICRPEQKGMGASLLASAEGVLGLHRAPPSPGVAAHPGNPSSKTTSAPTRTESESADGTRKAGTGVTLSPLLWEVLWHGKETPSWPQLVLLWPLLHMGHSLRAGQVDRDVQGPLARQRGSAGSPQGAVMCSLPKPEQQQQHLCAPWKYFLDSEHLKEGWQGLLHTWPPRSSRPAWISSQSPIPESSLSSLLLFLPGCPSLPSSQVSFRFLLSCEEPGKLSIQ